MNVRLFLFSLIASLGMLALVACGPGGNPDPQKDGGIVQQDGGSQKDTPSGCINQCPEGVKQCSGKGWQECTKQSNGCLDWGKVTDCPTGQICSGGQCRKNCLNQCTLGAKQCVGKGFQTCEQKNTGCTDWSETTDCEGGKFCSGGSCVKSCSNQCTEGAKQCSGNGVQTCEKQASGCTDWSTAVPCTGGTTCSGGSCSGTCSNQCTEGAKQCNGTGVQTCSKQANGCTDWGNPVPCKSGEVCSGGKCGGKCSNQCSIGSKQCNGSGYQTCEQKPNGCTDWSSILKCKAGEICSGGNCVRSCVNQCTEGAQQCSGTGIQKCSKQSTGCTDWGSTIPCKSNEICSGGKCVSQCVNQCTVGAKQCNGTGVQTCEKKSSGCTDWGTAVPCKNGETCSGGTCVSHCTNQCSEKTTRCNGTSLQTCKKMASGCTEWDTPQACPSGKTCSNGTCGSSQCLKGDKRCNGASIEECDSSGIWQITQVCPNTCDKGQCVVSAKCSAGARRCSGKQVEECNLTGTAWLYFRSCKTSCASGVCTGGCTPGAKRCNKNAPEICKADGSGWTASPSCQHGCIRGYCKENNLLLDNKTQTLDGEHYYVGDVILKNNSTIQVGPKGWLRIIAQNISIDSTSSIEEKNAKGNHPAGKGKTSTGSCKYYACSSRVTRSSYSGGGYGSTASTVPASSSQRVYNCYRQRYCYLSIPAVGGGARHGGYISEIRMGSSGGGCTTPNGGGMLDLQARNKLEIKGLSKDNLRLPGRTGGCGPGSGGGIRLIGEHVVLTKSVLNVSGGGAGAGLGRIKILHGSQYSSSASSRGVVEESIIPPMDLSSSTHPDSNKFYNDNFKDLRLSWSRPFTNLVGYYHKLSSKLPTLATDVPNTQATFHTGETASFSSNKLTKGTNYFHIVSVGPNAKIGTIESYFKVNINTTPVTIRSTSHPRQSTWYNQTTIALNWTNPVPDADVGGYYYVLDRYANTIPDKTDKFLPGKDKSVLFANRPAGSVWYFHIIAEDTKGYLTKAAAHFKIQIGPQPGKGGISGEVREASAPTSIDGVRVTLNRGTFTTTSSNGGKYFFHNNIYAGTYELRATKAGYEDFVKQVTVKAGQNTSLNISMKKKAP